MRVFSAMQPSGPLHMGNYFGSMLPNMMFAKEAKESYFFIVDLHALTTVQDPKLLKQYTQDALLDYLAAGFDPKQTVITLQSHVPAHVELSWLISTVAPMGLLERAHSYKDKVAQGIKPSVGLFTYPILMAADILLYDTDKVPVGKDQKQHVEIARDIAVKFNNKFGETFTVPEPVIYDEVAVVPGIDGQKMSKSYGNTIPLFGTDAEVKKAIMRIETDSKGASDKKDPDTCVIYQIHKLLLPEKEAKALADEYKNGLPYGEAKQKLLETYLDYFEAMRKKRSELTADYAKEVMLEGAKQANKKAEETMARVKKAVGLI